MHTVLSNSDLLQTNVTSSSRTLYWPIRYMQVQVWIFCNVNIVLLNFFLWVLQTTVLWFDIFGAFKTNFVPPNGLSASYFLVSLLYEIIQPPCCLYVVNRFKMIWVSNGVVRDVLSQSVKNQHWDLSVSVHLWSYVCLLIIMSEVVYFC